MQFIPSTKLNVGQFLIFIFNNCKYNTEFELSTGPKLKKNLNKSTAHTIRDKNDAIEVTKQK